MRIRPFAAADLPRLIDLTIETFGVYFEDHVRPLLGEELFRHQHGEWRQDYRDEVPTLHDPAAGRRVAVAEDDDGSIAGYVGWHTGQKPRHGQITMLAVSPASRRNQVGRSLCRHAIDEMKAEGVDVVGVFTGDDAFHAPARALYESLGLTKITIAGYLGKV